MVAQILYQRQMLPDALRDLKAAERLAPPDRREAIVSLRRPVEMQLPPGVPAK
jgi:hypothetical protein